MPHAMEEQPKVRVTTSAYDNTPASEIEALGELTRNETRLLNQGGAGAVREDRRFWHKETCRNMKCTDPKHGGLTGNEPTTESRMVPADDGSSGTPDGGPANQSQ